MQRGAPKLANGQHPACQRAPVARRAREGEGRGGQQRWPARRGRRRGGVAASCGHAGVRAWQESMARAPFTDLRVCTPRDAPEGPRRERNSGVSQRFLSIVVTQQACCTSRRVKPSASLSDTNENKMSECGSECGSLVETLHTFLTRRMYPPRSGPSMNEVGTSLVCGLTHDAGALPPLPQTVPPAKRAQCARNVTADRPAHSTGHCWRAASRARAAEGLERTRQEVDDSWYLKDDWARRSRRAPRARSIPACRDARLDPTATQPAAPAK